MVEGKDFVVIVFKALFKRTFSACYVKAGDSYTVWSKMLENKFYNEYCGEDSEDWLLSSDFKTEGIYGVGIGTPLNQD